MYALLIIFIIVAALVGRHLASPEVKGRQGEADVRRVLEKLPEGYMVINDMMLQVRNGATTQIDHLVVSKYGIFVIETKNYRGEIYGNDDQQEWKQIIKTDKVYGRKWWKVYTYITKNTLYNPVKQSVGHAERITRLLPHGVDIPVVPIVVFTGRADLSGVKSRHWVLSSENQLLSTIQSYNTEYVTEDTLRKIRIICHESNVRSTVDDVTHIRNVRSVQQRVETDIASGKCPQCGKPLAIRSGRYGKFMGCSGYPICKFTKEI